MYPRTWLRRLFFRWTRKGRAARTLGKEFSIGEGPVFELVTKIEADSVVIARQALEEWQKQQTALAASRASSRHRPENQYVSGARLASPPR